MKLVKYTLIMLLTASTIGAASAASTTTTEETYVYETTDGSNSQSSLTKLTTNERRTDTDISKMLDNKIDGYPDLDDDVSFSVHNGIVILKGTVDNTSERDHAGMIAQTIPGVVEVDNLIDVE